MSVSNYLYNVDFIAPCRSIKDVVIKSELSAKIFRVALPVFIAAGCALQRDNLTLLIGRTFCAFCGDKGWIPPALMISTYLALKLLVYINQKPENRPLWNFNRVVNWVKKIPENFVIGVRKLPQSLALALSTILIADQIFKALSINRSVDSNYAMWLKQESLFSLAIKGPFLEELFFRAFIQDFLVSSMTLINLLESRTTENAIIKEESINTLSRLFSAATFGLVHSNQSSIQAIQAGVVAYYNETSLYEKNGFFASFGLHCANNFFVCGIRKVLSALSKA